MRFWDSSAIVPLLIEEPESDRVRALYREDDTVVAWWGTPVECTSAVSRREREGTLTLDEADTALARLRHLASNWVEVTPSDRVRATARRLLRVHALRAADSLQLAAALVAAERDPESLDLVCLDERLVAAARREGFPVVG